MRDYMQLLSRTYRDQIARYERVDVAGISTTSAIPLPAAHLRSCGAPLC
jgi:hypothetical protein